MTRPDVTNPDPRAPLTPGRLAWLERLERDGAASRGRGPVGIGCMRAGWVSWEWRKPDGETATTDDLYATFGQEPGSWQRARDAGWVTTGLERLTEAGRAKLAEHRAKETPQA